MEFSDIVDVSKGFTVLLRLRFSMLINQTLEANKCMFLCNTATEKESGFVPRVALISAAKARSHHVKRHFCFYTSLERDSW